MDKITKSIQNLFKNWQANPKESRLNIAENMISVHGGKLLDIACSAGEFTDRFLKKDIDVYGFDIDLDRLRKADDKRLKVVLCDASEFFPFKDEEFDIVFAGEILQYIIDTDYFILEVKRVLKKNGKFVITTPNLASLENRIRILFGRYPIWLSYSLNQSAEIRTYTPKCLKRQLKLHGFKIIAHKGNWIPFIPQRYIDDVKLPILSMTGKFFPNLAMDIIIEAEKI